MQSVESSIQIDRPLAEVFAFVSDPSNDPGWHTDVLEAKRTSPLPVGTGTTFEWVLNFMGRKPSAGRVVEFEPPNRAALQMTAGPLLPKISYSFEDVRGATRFTRRVEVEPTGLMWLLAPMIRRMTAKGNARYLENLKRRLESGAGSPSV